MGIIFAPPTRKLAVLQYGRDEDAVFAQFLRTAGGVESDVSAYRLTKPGRVRALSLQLASTGTTRLQVLKPGETDPLATLDVDSADGGERSDLNVPVAAGDVLQVMIGKTDGVNIDQPLPVDASTVAKYAFDEAGGTTFADSSPNALGGSILGNPILGMPSRAGFGNAIEFPGSASSSTDFATVSHNALFNIPVGTVECMVKLDVLSGLQSVISRDASGQNPPGQLYVAVKSNGSVESRLQNVSQSITISTPAGVIVPGTWHHIAVIFGGPAGFVICVDGVVRVSSTSITTGLEGGVDPWVFGVRNWGSGAGSPTPVDGGSHMDGLLDEVRISNVRREYCGGEVNRPVATVLVEQS